MIRAIEEHIDPRTVSRQVRFDVLVHDGNVVDPVQAPCDPGLVGHDCDRDADPVEPGNRAWRPFDEIDSVDGTDVSVVSNYRAVAIKEDARPQVRALWVAHRTPFRPAGIIGRSACQLQHTHRLLRMRQFGGGCQGQPSTAS
jgi:hypothetical protein